MGRSPCCSKEGLNKGAWTALEDKILTAYIKAHGEGKWRNLPKKAGLKRCGKSCRLRWLNYLRPDIKRGNISRDEEDLIIRLHKLLGNRWSLIAGRLPGRTDNEIKNYWNTTLGKKADAESCSTTKSKSVPSPSKYRPKTQAHIRSKRTETSYSPLAVQVIRTKATRCSKAFVQLQSAAAAAATPPPPPHSEIGNITPNSTAILEPPPPRTSDDFVYHHPQDSGDPRFHCGAEQVVDFLDFSDGSNKGDPRVEYDCYLGNDLSMQEVPKQSFDQTIFYDWAATVNNATNMELDSLAFLLDSEEWPLN